MYVVLCQEDCQRVLLAHLSLSSLHIEDQKESEVTLQDRGVCL
jgi:hypothetical protein